MNLKQLKRKEKGKKENKGDGSGHLAIGEEGAMVEDAGNGAVWVSRWTSTWRGRVFWGIRCVRVSITGHTLPKHVHLPVRTRPRSPVPIPTSTSTNTRSGSAERAETDDP